MADILLSRLSFLHFGVLLSFLSGVYLGLATCRALDLLP